MNNPLIEQIEELTNGDHVTVTVNFYHPVHTNNPITGIVHKGRTNCGVNYFYIQPVGDPHMGAAITKGDIIKISSLQNLAK